MTAKRWPTLATALLVALIACAPEERRGSIFVESFEEVCDGTPCGWTRIDGTPEQALWIETIHPGEHGLMLRDEVQLRGPAGIPIEPVTLDDDLSFEFVARCDRGSVLVVELLFADEEGVLRGSARASAGPFTEWNFVTPAPLEIESGARNVVSQIRGLTLSKIGPGSCEISELAIDNGMILSGCE